MMDLHHLKLVNERHFQLHYIQYQSVTDHGYFSRQTEISKVTPDFKKCLKKIINNIRPISVLPVISKVFETVLFDQLA